MEENSCKYLCLIHRFTSAKHILFVVRIYLPSSTKPGLLDPLLPLTCNKQLQPTSPSCLMRLVNISAALAAVPKFLEAVDGCSDAEGPLHCLVSKIIDVLSVFERHLVLFLTCCAHDTWGQGWMSQSPSEGRVAPPTIFLDPRRRWWEQVSPWESFHSVLQHLTPSPGYEHGHSGSSEGPQARWVLVVSWRVACEARLGMCQ